MEVAGKDDISVVMHTDGHTHNDIPQLWCNHTQGESLINILGYKYQANTHLKHFSLQFWHS